MNDLILILIITFVVAILFLLLRAVNLWYWKINKILINQEKQIHETKKQNFIIEKILNKLGGEIVENEVHITEKSNLNDEENEIIEKLKSKIKSGEIIVKVKSTGKIEKWKLTDWDEIVEIGNQDKFEILFTNE